MDDCSDIYELKPHFSFEYEILSYILNYVSASI